jgi:phage terminase small subunit
MGGKGSGRIPVPAGLKLLHGRSEGRDSGGRIVPQPPRFVRETPEPPNSLDDEARAEWDRVVPHLEALDLLKAADQAALACYRQAVSESSFGGGDHRRRGPHQSEHGDRRHIGQR